MKGIIVKRTHEVTDAEWLEIAAGFNEEFKRDKKPADLIRYYKANPCGYSYHGLAVEENGVIAGFSSIMPYLYTDETGKDFLTGLSGSTFVRKEFRNDIFIFNDIYKGLRKVCAAEGIRAILGVPNKNSYKYLIKILGFSFLYNLPYFALPLQLSAVVQRKIPSPVNAVYQTCARLYIEVTGLVSLIYNPVEKKPAFNISFSPATYALRFNEAYTTVTHKQFSFTYRIYNERNMNIAYLFHFEQNGKRTMRALYKAVHHIAANEKASLVLFVGKLNLQQALLLKLPQSKEPQPLPLTIDVLLDKQDPRYAKMKEAVNWNFGLANFDVR